MASRKKRVERLEGPQKTGAAIVAAKPGESPEEAEQRHLAKHPEDDDNVMLIIH
jgi:hypothetical protein